MAGEQADSSFDSDAARKSSVASATFFAPPKKVAKEGRPKSYRSSLCLHHTCRNSGAERVVHGSDKSAIAPELNPRVILPPHTADDFSSSELEDGLGLSLTPAPEIDSGVSWQNYAVGLDFGRLMNLLRF